MSKKILFIVVSCFFFISPKVFACTINVGNNSQLQSANNNAKAGDVICVSSGNYTTPINPSNSGNNNNPITYKAAGKATITGSGSLANISKNNIVIDGFTFNNNGGAKSDFSVDLNGNNITFKNNTVTQTGPNYNKSDPRVAVMYRYGNGFRLGGVGIGGNNAVIENNTIQNFNFGIKVGAGVGKNSMVKNNTVLNSGQSAMVVHTSKAQIRGLLIEGNTFDGSWIEDGIQFAPDYSGNTADIKNFGTIVRDNVFKNMGENSLDFKSVRYIVIEGNVFYRTIGSNNGGMEGFFKGDNKQSCNSSARGSGKRVDSKLPVYNENNRLQVAGVTPCWMTWSTGSSTLDRGSHTQSDHLIFRNNVLYGNAGGMRVLGNKYKFYNNTALGNNTDFSGYNVGYRSGFVYKDNRKGIVFKNNLIGGHNGGEVSILGLNSPDISKLDISNNLYWGSAPHNFDKKTQTGNPHLTGISSNKPEDKDYNFADFALTQNSTNAIDKGTYLTKVTANSNNNKIKVGDPYLFTDGYGIVDGDKIIIKSGNNKTEATINSIDYNAKEITLNKAVNVSNGDLVSLYYTGNAPDIGAIEYGSTVNPTPTTDNKYDIDQNGVVNLLDLISLIKYIFGG